MQKAHVLIVDDHKVVADGLARLLELDGRFVIVGMAASLAECRAFLKRTTPDVIVLDLRLPDSKEPEQTARAVIAEAADTPVVVLTASGAETRKAIARMGATGVVSKTSVVQDLIGAILSAVRLEGGIVELTQRESEVVRLVAQGFTNAEIAEALGISSNTVKEHLLRGRRKLGAKNRTELVARARSQGSIN